MRLTRLFTSALCALAPFSVIANEQHDPQHSDSLAAHEHGVATLDIALEGQHLELQLNSPAMNLVGFEYAPSSAADKQSVAETERSLKNEQLLFTLTQAAQCALSAVTIENELTEHNSHDDEDEDEDEDEHNHSDIQVNYKFTCAAAEKLTGVDLAGFFKAFPHTEKINVQLITTDTQQGAELSHSNTSLSW